MQFSPRWSDLSCRYQDPWRNYLCFVKIQKGTLKNHHIKSMRMVFDGQRAYSHITVVRQADEDGGNAAEYSGPRDKKGRLIGNPLVPVVHRPKVITQSSGDDISIEQAWRNELGNSLRGIILKITLDHWVINNKFIRPNNTVLICEPRLYLYEPTKWFIESVDYTKDAKKEECVLTCVLPYVYNNEMPVNPFVKPKRNTPLDKGTGEEE